MADSFFALSVIEFTVGSALVIWSLQFIVCELELDGALVCAEAPEAAISIVTTSEVRIIRII
jgi:hypothetical protein